MNNNVTNQETYTVKEHTLLEVRHENGMTANYELDKENSCLELKTVYAKDEKLIELELPAFIIFEDVNLPVTSIAACVLRHIEEYGKINKIVIPPTVTQVSEYAFIRHPKSLSQIEVSNHEVLENVYIPKGIEVLTDTFETVDLRPKHHFRITDPKNGYSLLFQMNDNGNKLTLSGHENIAKGTCVVIPKEVNGYPVTKIGNDAFSWCTNLTGIVIPDSIREIGKDAFFNCENLTNVVIPDSVVKIKFCAFANCSQISGIIIPESVMDIEENVFGGCNNLSTIVVAEDNKFYDSREGCNAIIETATNTLVQGFASTIIPHTVTVIGPHAFNSCEELKSIVIPSSVTKICEYAFFYCLDLKNLVIPNSVEEIENNAFWGCESLVSLNIPESLTKIGWDAFGGESRVVSSIRVAEGNPVYDSREDCNAIIETATNTLVQGCNTTVIPDTVTKIESYAFIGCEDMEDMVIPESVKKIGKNVFVDCNSLKNIFISDASLLQCAGVPVGAKVIEKKSLLGNTVQALLEHENQQ